MMNAKSLLPVVIVPSAVLLIPAAAMLFKVKGWAWDASDFIVFWVLIAGVILTYKVVTRTAGSVYRLAAGTALGAACMLIWVNGAIGLIGSEDNPSNMMYGGVLALGVLGALLARLEPLGMSWALFTTALAQFLVPVIALLIRPDDFSPGVVKVFVLNFVFVLLFAASGLLFRTSAGKPTGTGAHIPA